MFIIKQSDSYSWPVEVHLPLNGKKEKHTFTAEFKRIDQENLRLLKEKTLADKINDDDLCREVLVGWAGVAEPDGREVPFTVESRDRLLRVALVSAAIVRAWIESLETDHKRKNS